MRKPWPAPMTAPTAMPTARAIIQVNELSNPMKSGRISFCTMAMTMARKPSREPTERSMLRETMMRTMPVAMTATEAVCTDRLKRLRGVRKLPPKMLLPPWPQTREAMSNMIQTISNAIISPSNRPSTSVER